MSHSLRDTLIAVGLTGLVLMAVVASGSPVVTLGFRKYAGNPVLTPGTYPAWDSLNVAVGTVLVVDGVFRMWYSGSPNNNNWQIGLAVSRDGTTWVKDPTKPVVTVGPAGSWDARIAWHPEVLYEDGLYKMWYNGWDESYSPGAIGYATSPDGVVWTKHAGNPVLNKGPSWWDLQNVVGGTVLHDQTGYRMWYSGSSDGGSYAAGLAFSSDGITWEKYTGNPVMVPDPYGWDSYRVHPTDVIATLGGLVMLYVGSSGYTQQIGIAASLDGISWVRYSGNPILTPGPDSWDSSSLSRPSLVLVHRTAWLWYTGTASGSDWQIGLATLKPRETRALLQLGG